jgi:uncharacterized membrane protein YoaK (UPF0700 family)
MKTVAGNAVRDLLLLSVTAGSADAAGFMGLGRIFTSNMTGNLVLLGISLGQGRVTAALHAAFVLLVFMAGTWVGALLTLRIDPKDWPRMAREVIGLEGVLLVGFAVTWCALGAARSGTHPLGLLAFLALAMGLQSAAMYRLNAPGVATTAITGTLTSLTGGSIRAFGFWNEKTAEDKASRKKVLFQALVIGCYLGGATLSGVLMLRAPMFVGLVPAGLVLFVVVPRWVGRD